MVLFLFLVLIPVGLHSDCGRLSSVSDSTVQALVVVLVLVQVGHVLAPGLFLILLMVL